MSKVQKALGKLRYKTQQAEKLRKDTAAVHKRALSTNDALNATVVEQNERLELLAGNCRHYRERIAESEDRINMVEEKNTGLYSRLKETDRAHADLITEHRNNVELLVYRAKVIAGQRVELEQVKRAHFHDRVITVVAGVAIIGYTLWTQPIIGGFIRPGSWLASLFS